MSTEFGWWKKDPDLGKFQVVADFHGGTIEWSMKQGHHTSWEEYTPISEDWEKLLGEAGKRVPRRLISPKQFDVIKALADAATGS